MNKPLADRKVDALEAPAKEKRRVSKAIGLTERHVQETITTFLQLDGWRAFKMEAVSESGFVARVMARVRADKILAQCAVLLESVMRRCMRAAGVGEVAMADYLYIRYIETKWDREKWTDFNRTMCEHLWIEFKRPGEKPRPDQTAWHELERKRGALVKVVGEEETWWEDFKTWYAASELQRHTPAQVARLMNEYEPPRATK